MNALLHEEERVLTDGDVASWMPLFFDPGLLQPLAMGQMVDVTHEVPQPEEGRVLSGPLPRLLDGGEEPQEVTQTFSGAIH